MKKLVYISLLIVLGCKEHATKTTEVTKIDSSNKKPDRSKYYTTKDTLLIETEGGDTLKYSKEEFNRIIDNHAELTDTSNVQDPDVIYHCSGERDEFGSEAGQDTYYALYAYFLKQKNGVSKYAERRKKLIDIYSNINALFSAFEYGGTYFGHQGLRILGYAEFSVYLYSANEIYISKTYDISKEKELYINSLRQIIDDESSIDFTTTGQAKANRNKELNKIVDNIQLLITDNFYLKRAQAFHYSKYEYY